jgi:hypothetical protein
MQESYRPLLGWLGNRLYSFIYEYREMIAAMCGLIPTLTLVRYWTRNRRMKMRIRDFMIFNEMQSSIRCDLQLDPIFNMWFYIFFLVLKSKRHIFLSIILSLYLLSMIWSLLWVMHFILGVPSLIHRDPDSILEKEKFKSFKRVSRSLPPAIFLHHIVF